MGTIKRAFRTITRSPLRTGLLVAVLAVSLALTLIMITVNAAFGERLDEIRSQVGSSITVTEAGSFGGGFFGGRFFGGAQGENADADAQADQEASGGLEETAIDQIGSIEHVAGLTRTLTVPYTGEDLVSAPPQLPEGVTPRQGFGNFTRPVLVTGTDNPNSLTTLGVSDPELVAGRTFNSDEVSANVAVIGSSLAEANSLAVGDSFEMEDASFEVVGVYTTGTLFGDNSVFLPLETAQQVFERQGEIDQAIVQAESVDYVEGIADEIRETLGADVVDVTTELSAFDAISGTISDAERSSQIGMYAALAASAAVILFSVGLVARQRIKEIGIVKALGASNWQVTAQFGVETAVVSVVAGLLGALATFPLAQTVANGLVSDPSGPGGFGGGGGPGGGRPGGGFTGGFGGFGGDGAGGFLGDVDVVVSPEIFLFALAIGLILAVLAAVVPAWYVSRVRPAEVLRYE